MIKAIFSLIALFLIGITLSVAAICYFYIPKVIQQQVVSMAEEKGIEELDLKGTYVSLSSFGFESLSGHHEGSRFAAKNLEILWSPSVVIDFLKLQYDNVSGEEIEGVGYKLPTIPLKEVSFELLEFTVPESGTLSLSGTARLNSTLGNPELNYDGDISLPHIKLNQCSLSVKPTHIKQGISQIFNSSPDLDFTLSVKKLIADIPDKELIEATLDGKGRANKSQIKGSLNVLFPTAETTYKIDGNYNTRNSSGVINYETEGPGLVELDLFLEKLKGAPPGKLIVQKR